LDWTIGVQTLQTLCTIPHADRAKLDVMVNQELAIYGLEIFEKFKAYGGNVDGIEHITDPIEAAKVGLPCSCNQM
jgi:hypothetical protein